MARFEDSEIGKSGLDDEFVAEECEVDGSIPKTEHFNIDISSEKDHMHSNFDDRTFAKIGIPSSKKMRRSSGIVTFGS